MTSPKRWQLWLGAILSGIPILMMAFAGFMKLTHAPQMVASWVTQFGWPERLMRPMGLVEVSCALLLAIPRTAIFGAIVVSAFLGAAFATHLRIGDSGGVVPIALAVFAGLGLYLRDERLRTLIPQRRLSRDRPRLAAMPS